MGFVHEYKVSPSGQKKWVSDHGWSDRQTVFERDNMGCLHEYKITSDGRKEWVKDHI